jgi:hypothetical protein
MRRLSDWLATRPGAALRIATTFAVFCSTLVVFRCASLSSAGMMLTRMASCAGGRGLPLHSLGLWLTFAVVLACHLGARQKWWAGLFNRLPAPLRGLTYGAALTLALVLAPDASKAFIYFQF